LTHVAPLKSLDEGLEMGVVVWISALYFRLSDGVFEKFAPELLLAKAT
jgi:hypothetical protein